MSKFTVVELEYRYKDRMGIYQSGGHALYEDDELIIVNTKRRLEYFKEILKDKDKSV